MKCWGTLFTTGINNQNHGLIFTYEEHISLISSNEIFQPNDLCTNFNELIILW